MKYEIKITFTTDRPLTEDERHLIVGACQVQVEEPADHNGEDMDVVTSEVESTITHN